MNEIHALQAGHANNALTGVLLPSVEQDSHYQPSQTFTTKTKDCLCFSILHIKTLNKTDDKSNQCHMHQQ